MLNRIEILERIRRFCFYSFLLFTGFGLQAQTSDHFGSLAMGNVDFSYNVGIKCVGDYYYFLVNSLDNYEVPDVMDSIKVTIIQTDKDFNEIARISSPNTFIEYIEFGDYVNEEEGYLLILSCSFKENLFKIEKLDLESLKIETTDSIYYRKDMSLRWSFAGEINDSTLVYFTSELYPAWYGLSPVSNAYLEISTTGKIKRVDDIQELYEPIEIDDAIYIKHYDKFFISSMTGDCIILNRELKWVSEIEGRVEFYRDGIIYNTFLDDKSCFLDDKNEYIHCIGYGGWLKDYMVSHIRIPIDGGELGDIDHINPMLEENLDQLSGHFLKSKMSQTDDIYCLFGAIFKFPEYPPSKIDTSTIFIFKSNIKDYELEKNEWFITFNNESEIYVWATDVDDEGAFIIVGRYNHDDFFYKTRNFYLKINSDGTITSTKGFLPKDLMVVYPNPTSGSVNVKGEPGDYAEFIVYDMQGRLLKNDKLNGSMNFDISDLHSGTYFIHFRDRAGKVIGNSKVVKY